MDAKRAPWLVWSLGLLALCGCTWDMQPPTAHQETAQPPESVDPPQVISDQNVTDNSAGEDDVSRTVLGWVGRVEDAEQRGKRPKIMPDVGSGSDHRDGDADSPSPAPRIVRELSEPVLPVTDDGEKVTPTESDSAPASQPALPPPPALGNVAVRAAPQGPAARPDPLSPAINAPAAARNAPTSLHDFLEQSPVAPEGAFGEQLDRRMMWVIAGDYERARAPLELVTAEQQELASRFIEAWIVVRDGHMGDPSRAASAAVHELAELQQSLQRLSDLSLPVLKICSAVRSYGQYDALEPPRLLAGTAAEFVLYCEVSDFASELRDGLYTTTFDMTTAILNRSGDVVLELKDADIVDRCRNRRHDCFIPRLVRLPTTLSPGQYVAKVTVVDKLGQKLAENRALFQLVRARNASPLAGQCGLARESRALNVPRFIRRLFRAPYDGLQHYGVVAEGALYRCGQPTPRELADLIERLSLHTVVSLRGVRDEGDPDAWERDERAACMARNVEFVTIPCNHKNPPTRAQAEQFLALCSAAERRPVLVHCRLGQQRTLLFCALYRVHLDGLAPEAAEREMDALGFGAHERRHRKLLQAFRTLAQPVRLDDGSRNAHS